jgi:hypothetical protein
MPRHCSILDFGRPLSNRHGVEDLPLARTVLSDSTRMAKVALTAKLLDQAAFEYAAALHEQTAIDRFGRHVHVSIARKGVSKPARDLLGRPLLGKLAGNDAADGRARR